VKRATVITGAGACHPLLSAIHPHPIEEKKARLLQQAFGGIATTVHENAAGMESGAAAKQ
jgi:hypothetical protein